MCIESRCVCVPFYLLLKNRTSSKEKNERVRGGVGGGEGRERPLSLSFLLALFEYIICGVYVYTFLQKEDFWSLLLNPKP